MPNSMPDLPKAQIGAVLLWIVSQAVAYGWIKNGPDQQTLSGAATVIALAWAWADAHLRGKRVIAHAMLNADKASTTVTDPPVSITTPPVVAPPV